MSTFKGLYYKKNNNLLAIIEEKKIFAISLDNELNLKVGDEYPFYLKIDGKEIQTRELELISEIAKETDKNFESLSSSYIFKQNFVYSLNGPEPDIYSIIDNGVIRHPLLDQDGVIRALSNQLQSVYYKEQKNNKKKMKP